MPIFLPDHKRVVVVLLHVVLLCCFPLNAVSQESQLFKFPDTFGLGCLVSTTESLLVSTKPESSGNILSFEAERNKLINTQQDNLTEIKRLKRQVKNLKQQQSSSKKTKKSLAKKKAQVKDLTKLDKLYSSTINAISACQNGTLSFVPCAEQGSTCDDGNECTLGDFCLNNKCLGNPLTLTTPKGCGVGACARTAPLCFNGIPGICTSGIPSAEICNNIDDNCNGSIDDGLDCGASNELCLPGQLNCNGSCTFTSSDPTNCGSCGFNCGAGNSCNSGICKKGLGQSCQTFSDCQSNICKDGVCCNNACGGFCVSCNQPGKLGTCSPHPANTDPDNNCPATEAKDCSFDGMCDGNGGCRLHVAGTVCANALCQPSDLIHADTCNGLGQCVDGGSVNCAPYICSSLTCLTNNCGSDTDCLSSHYCDAPLCTLTLPRDSTCTRNRMCSSGRCISGFCDGP